MKGPSAILEPRGSVRLDDYLVDIAWSADGRRLAIAGGEGKVALATFDGSKVTARDIGTHGLGALAVAWQPRGDLAPPADDLALAFATVAQLVAWIEEEHRHPFPAYATLVDLRHVRTVDADAFASFRWISIRCGASRT
mgnify:CR=1 FL=1